VSMQKTVRWNLSDTVLLMTPQAGLQKQIEKYRAMTGEERLKLALDLHELSCEVAREGIRYQNPDASPDEVERLLKRRIALAQRL
jgi:Rv0078B-related antitoxin